AEGARICQSILELVPNDAIALCGLGYFRLEQDSVAVAEKLFAEAERKQRRFMEARNGRALAILKKPRQKVKAKTLFEEVASIDNMYAAAWYNAAMTYLSMDGAEVFGRFEKVVERFPNHHDAYFKLGTCYERVHRPAEAVEAYVQQLKVNPNHWRARFCAARASVELLWQGGGWPGIPGFEQVLKQDPRRFLPFLGEMYLGLKEYEKAHKLYIKFLTLLRPSEQALYKDISLIINKEQRNALKETASTEREGFVKAFWQNRNPMPTSPANPRQLEHYRRVHYALLNYSEHADPWDRRGEIYIRFGTPDHRSWSDHMIMETEPDVVRVKNRLNEKVQNTSGATDDLVMNNLTAASTIGVRGRPVFPIDNHTKWESWIYTEIDGGIEINFVDQFNNYRYEFIEVPPFTRNWRFWKMMASESVVGYVANKMPSVYAFEYDGEALDVHYTTATFRAQENESGLEIYVGTPFTSLRLKPELGKTCAQMDWVAVLYDRDMNLVFRDSSQSVGCIFTEPDPSMLLIDQMRVDISPGTYTMGLEIRDRNASKVQYFRDSIRVDSFNDVDLALSDIEVASTAETQGDGENRFAKGDLQVVPLPSLAFNRDQSVYLYYEIYNLKRDAFGQTHYQIEYRLKGSGRNTALRVLQGLGQLAGLSEQSGEIQMAYNHKGQDTWERIYIALDQIKASSKDIIETTVQITDLNADGEPSVSKSARFVVSE
ncbi:MAG: GWxTD domain-containing protein, partial [Candidatus Latescibacteria bacterium]|nr:GWxTD domain-containing protein [Candidatus Latescibacterota bacterium]